MLEASHLADRAYTWVPGTPPPTLREMIKKKKNVLIMAEHHGGVRPWYQAAYGRILQDTPYKFELDDRARRPLRRVRRAAAGSRAPLLLVNHWLDTGLPNPERRRARPTRSTSCASAGRRLPAAAEAPADHPGRRLLLPGRPHEGGRSPQRGRGPRLRAGHRRSLTFADVRSISRLVTEQAMTRGFLGLDRRGWPGTIVVAALIALIAVGLPMLNALVSPQRALPPGTVVDVGRATTFTAADGWSEDVERTSPLEGRAVLTHGRAVLPDRGPTVDAIAGGRVRPLRRRHPPLGQARSCSTAPRPSRPRAGSRASPARTPARPGTGCFAVLRSGDTAVRVLAKGPSDAMATYLDDVDRMVQTLRIGTTR